MGVNSKYRPADVLVAPATLGDSFKSAGVAAYTAECRKHSSNDPKCQELGWVCIPLAVETYGNWDKEAQNTFSWSGISSFNQPVQPKDTTNVNVIK